MSNILSVEELIPHRAPMLLIDDEADNASINTRHGKGEVTRINGQLRDLLKTFEELLRGIHRNAFREHIHRPRQR